MSGRIVRGDLGIDEMPVALILVPADSILAWTETNGAGEYIFTDVGAGSLMVEAESGESGDFADVAYSFVLLSADTLLQIPDLDFSMALLESLEPLDNATEDTPNLFAPLGFSWRWGGSQDPLPRFRVRFYSPEGERIWFSEKIRDTQLNWNGIGSEGSFEGVPTTPGEYRWRLRVYGEDTREYTTAYRRIVFE